MNSTTVCQKGGLQTLDQSSKEQSRGQLENKSDRSILHSSTKLELKVSKIYWHYFQRDVLFYGGRTSY